MVGKRVQYSVENLLGAYNAVKSQKTSIRAAAIEFKVPFSTLHKKINLNCCELTKAGRPSYLTEENQHRLSTWVKDQAMVGDPATSRMIKDSAHILSARRENTEFPIKGPSDGWFANFNKKFGITKRKSEPLSAAAASVDRDDIIAWADRVRADLERENLQDILNVPSRNLNADESGFALDPQNNYVYVPKGTRNVHAVSKSKDIITTHFCIGADCHVYRPFIVYPGVRLSKEVKNKIPPGIAYTTTKSGWQREESFKLFLDDLSQQLRERSIQMPVILWVDGHSSHDTLENRKHARKLGIIMIRLFPNATQYIQPCDVGVFKPVKSLYVQIINSNKNNPNQDFVPNKENFAKVIKKVIELFSPMWIKTAFEATGIVPFNPNRPNIPDRKVTTAVNPIVSSAPSYTAGYDENVNNAFAGTSTTYPIYDAQQSAFDGAPNINSFSESSGDSSLVTKRFLINKPAQTALNDTVQAASSYESIHSPNYSTFSQELPIEQSVFPKMFNQHSPGIANKATIETLPPNPITKIPSVVDFSQPETDQVNHSFDFPTKRVQVLSNVLISKPSTLIHEETFLSGSSSNKPIHINCHKIVLPDQEKPSSSYNNPPSPPIQRTYSDNSCSNWSDINPIEFLAPNFMEQTDIFNDEHNTAAPEAVQETQKLNQPYLNDIQYEPTGSNDAENEPICSYNLAAARLALDTPFTNFKKIWGTELINKFEDKDYISKLEASKNVFSEDVFSFHLNLYNTYLMLKDYDLKMRELPSLPVPKLRQTKRKVVQNDNRHYVITSESSIANKRQKVEAAEKKKETIENNKIQRLLKQTEKAKLEEEKRKTKLEEIEAKRAQRVQTKTVKVEKKKDKENNQKAKQTTTKANKENKVCKKKKKEPTIEEKIESIKNNMANLKNLMTQ